MTDARAGEASLQHALNLVCSGAAAPTAEDSVPAPGGAGRTAPRQHLRPRRRWSQAKTNRQPTIPTRSRTDEEMLPSWNPGAARTAICRFIERVTDPENPDFVAPADRIATFDNDGTLWCEFPSLVQIHFLIDRVHALCEADPDLATIEPWRSVHLHGLDAIAHLDKRAALELLAETHGNMTEEEFATLAAGWLATARHPTLGSLFRENLFRPQLELLQLLRANRFRTFIVSGGGIEFIRAFAEDAYGVSREQVIGSSDRRRFEAGEREAHVRKLPELACFNDREEKPANIALHIGRRPILAFGNSDGDLAMLRYTLAGKGARLGLLLHHDDPQREFAYDRDFVLSPLAEALDRAVDYGLQVVSMRQDWMRVF